jgi:type VI secretion system protein ImpM
VIPGWYGKLPSLGDFASRRLPDEFVRTWDAWLQDVLQATRDSLGEAWLDRYLVMPIWRFVLLPELVGSTGWAGVLMPSVDRVGRHFPLTLAAPLVAHSAAAHAVFRGGEWFARLEDAALAALDPSREAGDFDGLVAGCSFAAPSTPSIDHSGRTGRWQTSVDDFAEIAAAVAFEAWSRDAGWRSLWWTRGPAGGDPLMLTSAELPTADAFGCLVDGTSHGQDASPVSASDP